MTKLKEVITPVAACALFGRSAEAVRRAVAEGFVKSSYALNIGARPIRLLDLDSALKYWHRRSRPWLRPIEQDIADMRFNSIVLYAHTSRDGALEPDPLSRVRILHHMPLLSYSVLETEPPKYLSFD